MVEVSINVLSVWFSPERWVGACLFHQPHTRKMQVNNEGLLGRKGLSGFVVSLSVSLRANTHLL